LHPRIYGKNCSPTIAARLNKNPDENFSFREPSRVDCLNNVAERNPITNQMSATLGTEIKIKRKSVSNGVESMMINASEPPAARMTSKNNPGLSQALAFRNGVIIEASHVKQSALDAISMPIKCGDAPAEK
jgi:hypothetical protein